MKRVVVILSLVAPVLLYFIGGFFFALAGFGFDVEAPPTSPQRVVGALIGYIPGAALALIALGMSLVATARSRQWGWFAVLLVWPLIPIIAGVLMLNGLLAFSDSWWLAALFVPLATAIYGAIGPAPLAGAPPSALPGTAARPSDPADPPTSAAPPQPPARFVTFVGVLALVTVLGFATLLRGAPPFSPLPAPTPTFGPPALTVRVGDGTANCATGSYPAVTIANATQQTVSWSASVNDPGITVSPASGTLAPGATASVAIAGHATARTFFTITFSALSSQTIAKIACAS